MSDKRTESQTDLEQSLVADKIYGILKDAGLPSFSCKHHNSHGFCIVIEPFNGIDTPFITWAQRDKLWVCANGHESRPDYYGDAKCPTCKEDIVGSEE